MIRALVWKEYREHRSVWLTMALVAFAALVGMAQLMGVDHSPGGISASQEKLYVVALSWAWLYGMVCGSMLLAGEREAETLPFLDMLPPGRLRLWAVKFLIGVALLIGQVIVLVSIAAGIQLVVGTTEIVVALLALLFAGIFGFGWGLFFSATGSSVLNVIGLALVGQILGAVASFFLLFLPLSILMQMLFSVPISPSLQNVLQTLCLVALIPITLVGSVWRFTRPDRQRGRINVPLKRPVSGRTGWRSMVWLIWRQARGLALGSAIFGLLAGLLLPLGGLTVWPSASLILGVVWGLGVFADEQRQGCFRFLADQRLPLRPFWWTKVGVRAVFLAGICLLVLLPGLVIELVRAINHPDPYQGKGYLLSRIFGPALLTAFDQPWLFLTLCPVYGFCVGVLAGLVCRKSLVTGAVAFSVTCFLILAWVPSLPTGGLHGWQLWALPLLFLLVSRLLLRPWAAGRLGSRGPILTLAAVATVSVLWVAGNLGYRAREIPLVPQKYDLAAFTRSMPPPDKNPGGEDLRSACARLTGADFNSYGGSLQPLFPRGATNYVGQAQEVVQRGWPGGNPELGRWLDTQFEDEWYQMVKRAADQPPGIMERPVDLTVLSQPRTLEPAKTIAALLAARGLQRQAAGDPADFVDQLRLGLNLARNLRRQSIFVTVYTSWVIERTLFQGLERWLENLEDHPDLLRGALRQLLEHEAALPIDFTENVLAEYLVAMQSLNRAEELLTLHSSRSEEVQVVARGVAFLWQVPWEKTRLERLVRMAYEGEPDQALKARMRSPLALTFLVIHRGMSREGVNLAQARLRAAILQVALRLYQAENSRPAESLNALVPCYLPAVPRDSFTGRPFNYRIARREWILDDATLPPPGEIEGEDTPRRRRVKPGQGVLWCNDDDRTEDGAPRPAATPPQFGVEQTYLVPLPPSRRR